MDANASATVAVVGSGYWGRNLVRNFHSLGALGRICDRDENVLRDFREKYPEVAASLSLSEVLADERIKGVVIATPAELHFTQAREALLSGRHVFVEKPLALGCDEARELVQIAREKGLTLMVGHLLRYHPAVERLLRLVDAGELGRINYIYSHRLNLGKIRRAENSLWSFAPHDISMILALAGETPESVSAVGGNYLHQRIADVTVTHLDFASGVKAHVFVSWLHPYKEQRLVVVGDRKMAVFDDTLGWDEKLALYPHRIDWEGHMPVPTRAEAEYVPLEEAEPLRLECAHFLHSIQSGEKPLTDGEEGAAVLGILNAAQQSLEGGGSAVHPQGDGSGVIVHESAYVDDGAVIGRGTSIWHFSHVMRGSVIGEGCRIGQNVVVGPDAVVGNRCKIQNNVSVYTGVTLEDDVFCGPSMVFTNVRNPRSHVPRMHEALSTRVQKGASLGANATVVCGVNIGRYAFVGAGSVVTKDIPDHALVMGNPARQTGWMCACGEKLDDSLTCAACGACYERHDQGLVRRE